MVFGYDLLVFENVSYCECYDIALVMYDKSPILDVKTMTSNSILNENSVDVQSITKKFKPLQRLIRTIRFLKHYNKYFRA